VNTDGHPLDSETPLPSGFSDSGQGVVWVLPPPRPKFQHKYGWHLLFFVLTFLTTTFAGWLHYESFLVSISTAPPTVTFSLGTFLHGLSYSVPLLVILGAHEFGHYAYCRRHDVDATLPYFLPAPLPLTGTFGAVIRIREAFPSTRALFDIGVAGPIAGFVVLLPFLWFGITHSVAVKFPDNVDVIYFGEPLLFRAMAWLHFGTLPDGFDVVLHPMGFAAWFGMLATALNLLPFGQLDGGHIAYAALGRRAWLVSVGTLATTLLLTLRSSSWISIAVIMLAMAFFLGLRHPTVAAGEEPLDGRRRLVAVFALVMFVLCFTPVPIDTFFGGPK
jgi:membrane-associated protease RseP (regulator of RpoE activity)